MTPLELVQGTVVERVSRKAGYIYSQVSGIRKDPAVIYRVTVRLPDGAGSVSFDSSGKTAWRRIVKKAGLRLTSNAARAAAEALRARIMAGVEAEKSNPQAPMLDSKIIAGVVAKMRKREEQSAVRQRVALLDMIVGLMKDARVSQEEAVDLWNKSVLDDVMGS
jgi:hypothetical protein